MKIAVIAQHDGLKPGAGKHMPEYMEQMYALRERLLADAMVDSWDDYGGISGPGMVAVMRCEQEALDRLLADEEFGTLLWKAEFMFVNWRWATYALTDEAPPEMMKKWTEMAVTYA